MTLDHLLNPVNKGDYVFYYGTLYHVFSVRKDSRGKGIIFADKAYPRYTRGDQIEFEGWTYARPKRIPASSVVAVDVSKLNIIHPAT